MCLTLKILDVIVRDIRFPTSTDNIGTDAVHIDCDYSATYVTILTEDNNLNGFGLTFTIGKGNDLCCKTVEHFKSFIINRKIDEIEKNILLLWHQITDHSQLRWLGPQKGVVHLATAAFFNAIWDIISKYHNKPLWKYILDLHPEELINKLSFSYIDDVISADDALNIIEEKKKNLPNNLDKLDSTLFPAYTTAAGWLGYSDEKMKILVNESLKKGWSNFKVKVGQDIERDIHRCTLIRDMIGNEKKLMVDSNQIWNVQESIDYINELKKFNILFYEEPTSTDDILGFRKIKDAHPDVNLATGEMIQNKIIFKQFIENKSLDFCQIDSCRLASLNEIIPVLLMSSKFDIPVVPHAGGVGLCEYVQHINIVNKFLCSNNDFFLCEYADSCWEHFENPSQIINGCYVTPVQNGYSVKIKDNSLNKFDFNTGKYWN